ncbi:hypothetical protein GCM10009540_60700 [Streptomyces turgidiscabies]
MNEDHEVVIALTRIETKLDAVLTVTADHEARLRRLEENDLGRIIPFLIGLGTLAAIVIALFK